MINLTLTETSSESVREANFTVTAARQDSESDVEVGAWVFQDAKNARII